MIISHLFDFVKYFIKNIFTNGLFNPLAFPSFILKRNEKAEEPYKLLRTSSLFFLACHLSLSLQQRANALFHNLERPFRRRLVRLSQGIIHFQLRLRSARAHANERPALELVVDAVTLRNIQRAHLACRVVKPLCRAVITGCKHSFPAQRNRRFAL